MNELMNEWSYIPFLCIKAKMDQGNIPWDVSDDTDEHILAVWGRARYLSPTITEAPHHIRPTKNLGVGGIFFF